MTPVASTEIEAPPIVRSPLASAAPREVGTDLQGGIAEDIGCSACGYNLRGLTATSACPECSLPIGLSIKGDLLQFSNPNWVERLVKGVMLIIVGIFANIVFSIAFGIGMTVLTISGSATVAAHLALGSAGVILSVIFVYGVWLLTASDPSKVEGERALSARLITRWFMLTTLVHWPLQMALTASMGMGAPNVAANPMTAPTPAFMALSVVVVAIQLLGIVAYVAGLILLRSLALRIPRQSLAKQTSIVIWGYGISLSISVPSSMIVQWLMFAMAGPNPTMPVLFFPALVGNCVGGLGVLTFGIWAIVLLFLYHGSFRRCAAAAKAIWAETNLQPISTPISGI